MTRFLIAFIVASITAFSAAADEVDDAFLRASEAYNKGDYAAAFKDMSFAAERGHAVAQYNVGLMYNLGQGVAKNYGDAFLWYTMAVEQGVALAALNLGRLYATGEGVTQDYVKAYVWTSLAVDTLSPGEARDGAIANLELDAAQLTPEQIATAKKLAREWLERHAAKSAQ